MRSTVPPLHGPPRSSSRRSRVSARDRCVPLEQPGGGAGPPSESVRRTGRSLPRAACWWGTPDLADARQRSSRGPPFFRLLREHLWRPAPTVFARKSAVLSRLGRHCPLYYRTLCITAIRIGRVVIFWHNCERSCTRIRRLVFWDGEKYFWCSSGVLHIVAETFNFLFFSNRTNAFAWRVWRCDLR